MGIDRDRSSIMTVAERESDSVRSISKSTGASWTGVPGPSGQCVADRPLDRKVERIAPLVRLGLAGSLVARARGADRVLTGAVLGQPCVEVGERLVTYSAQTPGRQLQASALLLDQSRVAQLPGQVPKGF